MVMPLLANQDLTPLLIQRGFNELLYGFQKVWQIEILEHVTDHYVIFIMIGQCACFAHQKL